MKPEITAATDFLSRIFLAHDNIAREKVAEFQQQLSGLLEERFRNHWHENCPRKGQAYRCIRVCPEEPLDPILEKVCAEVGINVTEFNLPFELTLWVDPTEVVCKFGDLKCSYHTVAKKDNTSGNLNNQTDKMDINDLLENARDLYTKKQTIVIHPVHSTEMIIPNPFSDNSHNCVTMAIRINGTMHYHFTGLSPPVYDGLIHVKGQSSHSIENLGGVHYFGKSLDESATNFNGSLSDHYQETYFHDSDDVAYAYNNIYLNSFAGDENGCGFEQMSCLPPTKNSNTIPPFCGFNGSYPIYQSSPTPEQIQHQLQHPPPMPSTLAHLQQTFNHRLCADLKASLLLQQPPPHSTTSTTSATNNTFINCVTTVKATAKAGSSKQ